MIILLHLVHIMSLVASSSDKSKWCSWCHWVLQQYLMWLASESCIIQPSTFTVFSKHSWIDSKSHFFFPQLQILIQYHQKIEFIIKLQQSYIIIMEFVACFSFNKYNININKYNITKNVILNTDRPEAKHFDGIYMQHMFKNMEFVWHYQVCFSSVIRFVFIRILR